MLARVLIALALLMPLPAAAQTFENLDRIDSLVTMTVGANVGEPGGPVAPVDKRLRLAPCPTLPSVQGPVFGAAVVSCPAIGWRIRVPLRPDAKPAVTPQAKVAPLIRKGDPVQLVAGDTNFTVSRAMIADQDGGPGDTIRVREDARSTPVMARVEAAGIVRIPGI
jgi:flagella basal body P-ring formation protein FlgA